MGAVDAQIAVKRDAANNIIATIELMKDGSQGDVFASRLEVIEIGIDDDGDKITSHRRVRLVPPASNHIPVGVKCVTQAQWRDYAYRQGITGSDDARARQLAFQRAHETLVSAKQVAV